MDDTDTSSPFPETADIETSNDDYATRFRGATGAWMLKVQERGVLKLLGARVAPGATVLDVGGGHGQLAHPLADAGYKVSVIGSAPSCRHHIADLVDADRCSFEVGRFRKTAFSFRRSGNRQRGFGVHVSSFVWCGVYQNPVSQATEKTA